MTVYFSFSTFFVYFLRFPFVCWNVLIESVSLRSLNQALNMMDMLGKANDSYPLLPMYSNLLGGCARIQCVNRANECLDLMEG